METPEDLARRVAVLERRLRAFEKDSRELSAQLAELKARFEAYGRSAAADRAAREAEAWDRVRRCLLSPRWLS